MKTAGFGFRASATVASLRDALTQAGGDASHLVALAAPADKAASAAFQDFAAQLDRPIVAVNNAALAAAFPDTLSAAPNAALERGPGSPAEAAALVAAGPNARLIAPRAVSSDRLATCALATHTPVTGDPA